MSENTDKKSTKKKKDIDEIMEEKDVIPLDQKDIQILKAYGRGTYQDKIKKIEDEIKQQNDKIIQLVGIKEEDTGLSLPSQWNISHDKQLMQQDHPLMVTRCTKIIDGETDNPK